MDFQEILAQASHNAQKANKVVNNLDQEAHERKIRRKEQYERELAREREERKRKAPPKVEKKFVIPKKKEASDGVDSNALHSYMEKQRKAKLEKEILKKKERDKLIGLRLQANQGKANKKIASQFGKSVIELQQRYAPNSHIEIELLKRQQRELEDLEKQSAGIRDSMAKAMKDRAAILARSSAPNERKEKTRVGNIKANGFANIMAQQEAVLTKRKAESFNTFASNRDKPKKPNPAPSGEAKLDFNALMAKAKQNSDVKNVAAKADQILRPNQSNSSSREIMKRALVEQRKVIQPAPKPTNKAPISNGSTIKMPISNGQSSSRNQLANTSNRNQLANTSSSSQLVKKPPKIDNPYALSDRHVLGAPSVQKQQSQQPPQKKPNRGDRPLPPIPQPPPSNSSKKEPRILPGDIRYNPYMKTPSTSSNANKRPPQPTNSNPIKVKEKRPTTADALNDLFGSPPRSSSSNFKKPLSPVRHSSSQRYEKPHSSSSQRFEKPSSSMSRKHEKNGSRPHSNPAMFGKRSGGPSSSYLSGYDSEDNSENEDEEDEYDSELDDFIDDSNLEELQMGDFEESLKAINRNYDKKRWKAHERMIDERRMESNYGDIEKEEKRSAKLALYEDFLESQKGSKGLA